jgi:hypothetical protein
MVMFADENSEIEYLRTFFEGMRRDGFNPDEELTWSYAFRDADVEKLKRLAKHLESLQYRVVDLFEDDDPDDGGLTGEYILDVEKVEKHTPETLAKRNKEFAELDCGYGGYSVGREEFL